MISKRELEESADSEQDVPNYGVRMGRLRQDDAVEVAVKGTGEERRRLGDIVRECTPLRPLRQVWEMCVSQRRYLEAGKPD